MLPCGRLARTRFARPVLFNNSFEIANAPDVSTCGGPRQQIPVCDRRAAREAPLHGKRAEFLCPVRAPIHGPYTYTFPANFGTWQVDNLSAPGWPRRRVGVLRLRLAVEIIQPSNPTSVPRQTLLCVRRDSSCFSRIFPGAVPRPRCTPPPVEGGLPRGSREEACAGIFLAGSLGQT